MYGDVINNEFPKVIGMLESYLDFKRWGFELIYAGDFPQYLPFIIYQSRQCKIKFTYARGREYESPKIHIDYGRSHSLLDQRLMMWNGEKRRCWHEVEHVISFLDGFSPTNANESNFPIPSIVHDFYEFHGGKGLEQKEYIVRKNAYIWEHYGQRLFDVFDLRHPELWSEYEKFLKEYYIYVYKQNKVSEIPGDIPPYKVC